MKTQPFLSGLIAFALVTMAALAQPNENDLLELRDRARRGVDSEPAPKVDAKKIINDSNNFMKEREPEMTSEEYALYQKMSTILDGSPELAIKFIEGMMNDKEQPSAAFELILGNAYYAAGQIDKAEAHFRAGLKRYPTFLRAWENLGILYYTAERYADAVPCFTKAVELGDHDATTYGLLGYSLEKTGNRVGAEMAYMQALGGAPTSVDWKQGLLRLYLESKQYGRVESLVRTLIREQPTDAHYWLTYAHALLSDHDKRKAMAVLEVAANAGYAGPDELALLGDLYAEQQLTTEAAATYRKVAQAQPQIGARKLLNLVQVLIADGRLDQAEATLGAAPIGGGREGTAWLLVRADLRLARKKWSEARQDYEAVGKAMPLDGRTWFGLGQTYFGEGDIDRAALAYEAALKDPATTYRANLELANIAIKNREYSKALEHLKQAYNLEKSEPVADLIAQVKGLLPHEL